MVLNLVQLRRREQNDQNLYKFVFFYFCGDGYISRYYKN